MMRTSLLLGAFVVSVVMGAITSNSAVSAEFDATKMIGTWQFVSSEKGGEKASQDRLQAKVVITKETLTLTGDDGDFVMKYELDADKTPVKISLTVTESPFGEGATAKGIVALEEDQLRLCYDDEGGSAPTEFASKAGQTFRLIVLKRAKQ